MCLLLCAHRSMNKCNLKQQPAWNHDHRIVFSWLNIKEVVVITHHWNIPVIHRLTYKGVQSVTSFRVFVLICDVEVKVPRDFMSAWSLFFSLLWLFLLKQASPLPHCWIIGKDRMEGYSICMTSGHCGLLFKRQVYLIDVLTWALSLRVTAGSEKTIACIINRTDCLYI